MEETCGHQAARSHCRSDASRTMPHRAPSPLGLRLHKPQLFRSKRPVDRALGFCHSLGFGGSSAPYGNACVERDRPFPDVSSKALKDAILDASIFHVVKNRSGFFASGMSILAILILPAAPRGGMPVRIAIVPTRTSPIPDVPAFVRGIERAAARALGLGQWALSKRHRADGTIPLPVGAPAPPVHLRLRYPFLIDVTWNRHENYRHSAAAEVKSMADYRAYTIGHDGHFGDCEARSWDEDSGAIEWASKAIRSSFGAAGASLPR